jgi:ribosomal protein S18 acetylase RimI-like enzyme
LQRQLLEIRPATDDDIDRLLPIFTAVAGERLWISTEPGFDPGLYRERWRRLLRDNNAASFAALYDGLPAGQLNVYPHDEYGHIIGMYVDAQQRGKGIGTKLLDAGIAWARERGLSSISLLVFPHNTHAISLYRKAGFEQRDYFARDVPRRNGEVWDSVLMTKIL